MLESPEKVKLGCCPLVPPAAAVLLGRNSDQGTGTSFSPVVPPPPALEDGLSEMTAKSIFPEAGLMMTSLMVPSVWPEESLTWAPVNWLARVS